MLLTKPLNQTYVQLAAVLVFFGPVWTGLGCFVWSLASHKQDLAGTSSLAGITPGARTQTLVSQGLSKVVLKYP